MTQWGNTISSVLLLSDTRVSLCSVPEAWWSVHVDRWSHIQTRRPSNPFPCISSGRNIPKQACICEGNLQSKTQTVVFIVYWKICPRNILHQQSCTCVHVHLSWNFACKHILAKPGLLGMCIFCWSFMHMQINYKYAGVLRTNMHTYYHVISMENNPLHMFSSISMQSNH